MAPPCSSPGRNSQRSIRSRSRSRSWLPTRQPNGASCPWRRHGRKRSIFLRVLPWCTANVVVLVVLSAGWHSDHLPYNTATNTDTNIPGGPNTADATANVNANVNANANANVNVNGYAKTGYATATAAAAANSNAPLWSLLGLIVTNGVLVAWLLVARTLRSLRRSWLHRDALDKILWNASCLVRTAVVVSRRAGNNHDRPSREWRSELAYRAILVVRTAASNAGYAFHKRPAYFLTELDGTELEQCLPPSDGNDNDNGNGNGNELRLRIQLPEDSRVPTSRGLASFEVPTTLAHLLQETICGCVQYA